MTTTTQGSTHENKQVISPHDLLNHWQGHRNLTRRVIEAFPEKDFFEFSIAGMRTFAELTDELLAIAVPGMSGIINRDVRPFEEDKIRASSKAEYLARWDKATLELNDLWSRLAMEDFSRTFNLFGEYEFPVIENIFYFIDNEVHHRGQGYVYLRALGIQPPFFWER